MKELTFEETMMLDRTIRDRLYEIEKILKYVEESEFLVNQYTKEYETLNNILRNKL